jgi:hypothetical protein
VFAVQDDAIGRFPSRTPPVPPRGVNLARVREA